MIIIFELWYDFDISYIEATCTEVKKEKRGGQTTKKKLRDGGRRNNDGENLRKIQDAFESAVPKKV